MFITLTLAQCGSSIDVVYTSIRSVEETEFWDDIDEKWHEAKSAIRFQNGDTMYCRETREQIVDQMKYLRQMEGR